MLGLEVTMVIKLLTALLLVAHGLGHAMAPQAAFVPPGRFLAIRTLCWQG